MADRSYFVGIDVGGTNLRAALRRAGETRLLAVSKTATRSEEGYEPVLGRAAGLVREVLKLAGVSIQQVGGVGLGLPGRLNPAQGIVEYLPNLVGNWVGVQAAGWLAAALALPIYLINDARAMTLGEWQYGAGQGVACMVCFTLGTGIGGGVVMNKQLLWGINGTLGELGHQVVEADGLPCTCGGRGCLEVYASGTAIAREGARLVLAGVPSLLGELAGGAPERITGHMVAQAAWQGDAPAKAIFERAGLYLGMVISNVVLTINPQRVVVGGGLAEVGDLILEPARRTLRERVHLMPVDQVEIIPAQLGDAAGLMGASYWAEQQSHG